MTIHPSRTALGLIPFGLAVTAAALIGVLGVTGTTAEYQNLRQPSWAPPSWLFGPVWTTLYAMIAVAGWLVWRRTGWSAALTGYAAQLVLNAAWTPVGVGDVRDRSQRRHLVGELTRGAPAPAAPGPP
jgi:tryptophan-rich sensory protein